MKSLTISILVLLASWASATTFAETVKIAAEDDWAPYSSIKADKSGPEGFAVDIIDAAFKTQGIDVEYVVVPFTRCLHYAKTGITVGCFDATVIESNKNDYYWHPTPLFYEELAIFTHTSSTAANLTQKDLEGKTLGYTIGYTYPTELMENPNITKFGAKSDNLLIQMAAAQRIDYILLNGMAGIYKINQIPEAKGKIKKVGIISIDGFWLAFSKIHPDGKRLVETFEKGLQELKHNGSYAAMETKFRRDLDK
ncbi:MAG: transporter substrate-binding domain-containing protein [Methylococcales bacterium]